MTIKDFFYENSTNLYFQILFFYKLKIDLYFQIWFF